MIPVPLTERKVALRDITVEERRLKVNPFTLHNPLVIVEGSKVYEAITTGVPTAKLAKVPVFPPNTITSEKVAALAVANEGVLKLAVPAIFKMPVIGVA